MIRAGSSEQYYDDNQIYSSQKEPLFCRFFFIELMI